MRQSDFQSQAEDYLIRAAADTGSHILRKWYEQLFYHLVERDFTIDSASLKSLRGSFPAEDWLWLKAFRIRPVMSVLMPVYNTDPDVLKRSIESVLNQVYKKWELCIVDDASERAEIKQILKYYSKKDSRIRVRFSDKNEGIAVTINKAAQMASGEYIGVLDHDDELEPLTLFEYVRLINAHPDADCIYCDEDKIAENGKYCYSWFKSDWNPDLSLSFNYVMHFAMYRRSLFKAIGGVRKDYEGSQDYDLLLRASEKTDKIYHIPQILYHWRMGSYSIASGPEAKPDVFVKGLAALNDALRRRNISGVAEDAPNAWKGVYRVKRNIVRPLSCSVVIRSYGNESALNRVSDSLPSDMISEILVCVHSSVSSNTDRISGSYKGKIRQIVFEDSDNFPNAFNTGARQASGEILFFLDETLELISPESYICLLEHVQREEVGAVGGKIYYENGLMEHGGIILGPFDVLGYAHRATPDGPGYAGLNAMICNYSAVMGLGMMTRRKLFLDRGGFDHIFERAYWDADYCLRLRQKDYLITYTPYSKFRHYIPVKAIHEMVVEPESSYFRQRWQNMIDSDPYFNANFSRLVENFTLKISENSLNQEN